MSTDEKKLARAILDLAHCISSARESRSLSVEELATRTGLEVIDIEMIEEGDVSDTSILMRVLDALDAQVELGAGFRVAFSSTVAALPLAPCPEATPPPGCSSSRTARYRHPVVAGR